MSAQTMTRRPRWLTVVGVLGVIATGFTVWLGLWITPPDQFQGNLARLLYIHPAIATVALYWVGLVAAGGSLLYLWPRTRSLFWDRLAAASVEVGAVFAALTLVTGAIWGRPVWGVWWTWDARLTSTALLLLLEIGLGVLHIGFGCFFRSNIGGDVSLGSRDGCLLAGNVGSLLHIFNRGDGLALLHLVALFHVEVGHATHHIGADVDISGRLDLTCAAHHGSQILLHQLT